MPGKRESALSCAEYFMKVALLTADRSFDPRTQVGACIVSKDFKLLAVGYNQIPKGMDDNKFNWLSTGEEKGEYLETKNPFVIHAGLIAILDFLANGSSLEGATIFVTLFPCNGCAKAIIQSKIVRVVYLNMYSKQEANKATKKMFDEAGVEYIEYKELLELQKEDKHKKMIYKK